MSLKTESEYTSPFKFADITPVDKKGSRFEKNNYRPISYLFYQRILKNACINKFVAILIIYFLNISVDLEKVLVHNIAYLL